MTAGTLAQALGIPLFLASVEGSMLVAQVRILTNAGTDPACPACHFTPGEWQSLNASVRYRCDGGGRTTRAIDGPPTMSVSALCGTAAHLVSLAALRLTVGLGPAETDRIVTYAGYTDRVSISPLARAPSCPCPHLRHRLIALSRPLAGYRLADLCAAAGVAEADLASVECGPGLTFVAAGPCGCDPSAPRDRFLAFPHVCPHCATRHDTAGFAGCTAAPADRLRRDGQRTLAERCIGGEPHWVVLATREPVVRTYLLCATDEKSIAP